MIADRKELIDNSRRIMRLIKERGYNPKIARGPNGTWVITFLYNNDDVVGQVQEWTIKNDDLIKDQWWLK